MRMSHSEADKKPAELGTVRMSELRTGTWLSRTSYIRVQGVLPSSISVKSERGYEWNIGGDIVEHECISASHFDKTVLLSRSEVVRVLQQAGQKVFTVCFAKKPTAEDIVETLDQEWQGATSKALRKQVAAKLLEGKERTLVGYLFSTEPEMGRSRVIDLEVEGGHRERLVDHRGIRWLILERVKYAVK